MDLVITPELVAVVASAAIAAVESVYYFCKNRIARGIQEEISKIENYVNINNMSEYDKQKAQQTKELMEEIFGQPVREQIQKMSQEERIEKLFQFAGGVAELYGVTIEKIVCDESEAGVCGAYQHQTKIITLNRAYFLSNDWNIQREMLDTIIHECRHAVQLSILDQIEKLSKDENENPWHISLETAERWARNHLDYFEDNKIPFEYMTNQLEVDARTFSYICMEGV